MSENKNLFCVVLTWIECFHARMWETFYNIGVLCISVPFLCVLCRSSFQISAVNLLINGKIN